jgi:predicted hydrocarbon binding protein
VLLSCGVPPSFTKDPSPQRVPLTDYLRYRDAALDFLQDTFCATAFETGRILARTLIDEHEAQLKALAFHFRHSLSKLPLIAEAAVLGARGNPGIVRASIRDGEKLSIVIENCPECRGLTRDAPFCFLNQGLIVELAGRYLGVSLKTEETQCIATGGRACEIQVELLARASAEQLLTAVCAWCHRVRFGDGSWHMQPDLRSRATLSHGICEDCAEAFRRKEGLKGPK